MRKTTTNETNDNFDKLNAIIHELHSAVDDEMDRLELKSFIRDDNLPRFSMLNEDDRIGVEEVLIIGSYLAINKLHNELHDITNPDLEDKLRAVLEGEIELKEVAPENMPDELLEALEGIVEVTREIKNIKKKGKK